MASRRKAKDAKKAKSREMKPRSEEDGARLARKEMPIKERKIAIQQEVLKMKSNFLGMTGQIQDTINTQYKAALQLFQNELFACEDVIEKKKNENIKLKNLLKKHHIKTDK